MNILEIPVPNSGRRSRHTLYVVRGHLTDGRPAIKCGRSRRIDERLESLAALGLDEPLLLVHARDSALIGRLERIWKSHLSDDSSLQIERSDLRGDGTGFTETAPVTEASLEALSAVMERVQEYVCRYGKAA